ncbi:Asp-tRNA(Asn)/Glu-tRNA(Gln) amidotransferase subunit GatC [Candidatus Parcubacteria bacterium]|nr:Asp-tRNA(Asn)/Glu-tRNA(Gln) amidotransferase subunit GatC [Candidatus Parcubacteria bacterium]
MISKDQIQHIAKLAKLDLSKSEEENLAKDLDSILDYVEKMKEADVTKIEPTSHCIGLTNVFRSDGIEVCDPTTIKIIKDDFLQTKGEYLKVKSVFNNGD